MIPWRFTLIVNVCMGREEHVAINKEDIAVNRFSDSSLKKHVRLWKYMNFVFANCLHDAISYFIVGDKD